MTRILLRSRKDPFAVISPEVTLRDNVIGNNSGNLIFGHAAHRILSVPGVEITSNQGKADPADAARINTEYDAFVIPLANAFRLSFLDRLTRMTRLIEKLRIPVVILGVGAQADTAYSNTERLDPIRSEVKRFVSAVLDRSASIGVRGEFTESYLRGLGFRDVDVIGCPSLFLDGPRLQIEKTAAKLSRDSMVAINISPYVKAMGAIVMAHHGRYPNLVYVAQDIASLELLLWGEPPEAAARVSRLPVHMSHPLYRENKIRFFVDPVSWLSFLANYDFSFGTRIHGNIAALLAGTPAVVLTHDSRTLELARYHEIPHRLIKDLPRDADAADLYAEADFGAFNRGHKARFETFAAFLERNGLRHAFSDPAGAEAFDRRLASIAFPPPVEALTEPTGAQLAARLRWLRDTNAELAQMSDRRGLPRLRSWLRFPKLRSLFGRRDTP